MPTVSEKRATFRELHQRGCFVIPNPWDVSSARWLQGIGFKALASTSAGFAWSKCLPDNAVTREMVLEHLRDLVANTDIPINADYEGGFAHDPAGVAESVALACDTGVAGLSIEDSKRDKENPVYTLEEGTARIAAARAAIDKKGGGTLLVGRSENFLVGRPDLDDTIKRLQAFQEAVNLDPGYAAAYAGLADTWQLLPDYGSVNARLGLARARTAALRAIALDSTLAEAHASLGAVLDDYDHDRAGAEHAYRTAILLNPGYATARQWLAIHLADEGRHEEAAEEIERARWAASKTSENRLGTLSTQSSTVTRAKACFL